MKPSILRLLKEEMADRPPVCSCKSGVLENLHKIIRYGTPKTLAF
jgi:hypothetical protein